MRIEIPMPKMGESIMEGTILKWHKKVGETIRKDEILFEISTDKVDSEIPSPIDGVVAEIIAEEGTTLDVGKIVAFIESDKNVQVSLIDTSVKKEEHILGEIEETQSTKKTEINYSLQT